MTRAFVAVGSNLGDREKNLFDGKSLLERSNGIKITRSSPVYETDPVGGPPQGKYLNAVWEIDTELTARHLLDILLGIETALGRTRRVFCGPRVLDLDLLFYGDQIIDEAGLAVPHPRLHERLFVLKPMMDLAPGWTHPRFQKTIENLLEEHLESHKKS